MRAIRRMPPRRKATRGAAILELAILLPLLMMLVLGILEFGRALVVQEILTNAAREGARRAAISGASHDAALAAIDNYLANEGITGHTRSIVPNANTVAEGDPITVTVSVAYTEIDFGIVLTWLEDNTLNATVVMRKE